MHVCTCVVLPEYFSQRSVTTLYVKPSPAGGGAVSDSFPSWRDGQRLEKCFRGKTSDVDNLDR